jgi:iron complex outermembrane recepter protein
MAASWVSRTFCLGVATALCGAQALAQISAPSPNGNPPDHGSASSSTELAEVIVTATRRSESIQIVPGEVTALTGSSLNQLNAHDFSDFAAYIPGLSYSVTGPSSNLIVIRGITTGSQLSSAIGLYLDDVPLGASSSFGLGYQSLNINLFDLNRVEVLNGPQGTLYGATSLGGTVKYITALPDLKDFSAQVGTEVSSTEHGGINHTYRGMVNLPFGNGIAAVRIDGFQEYDSGYIKDPVYDRDNQGWDRAEGGRISLLLQFNDELDIRLTALTQHTPGESEDVGFRNPMTHQPTLGTYDQAYPTFQPSKYGLTLYSGVVDYDLPWAKFTSISGLQTDTGSSRSDGSYIYDPVLAAFGGGTAPFSLGADATTKKFTEEFRLASHENRYFNWLVGGYFDTEKTIAVVALFDDANTGGTFLGLTPFNSFIPSTYREYAAYADGTVTITQQFDIGLGVRYSKQRQAYQESVDGLLATGSDATLTPPVVTSDQSVTTYLINPKFRITDDTMLYARAASGFRPGGPNIVLKPGLGNPTFAPDSLWSYEIGEKSSLLDKRATLNFDIYDILWKDIQVTVNNGGVNQLENAGDARVKGAELAFDYRILPALTVGGSAAYTDAKLDSIAPVLGLTYAGARLPLSPRYNFALVGNYSFNIIDNYTGMLTVSDRYVGDRLTGFGTAVSPQYALAAYNLTDLNLAVYAPHGVQLGLFLKNVFDKAGELSATTVANEYDPGAPVPVFLTQPRTVGLSVNVKFN